MLLTPLMLCRYDLWLLLLLPCIYHKAYPQPQEDLHTMLRLEVLPSSWSPMQDCTSIEGLPSVELDTLIVARWAHGLVPLFRLAILGHLCWMYWLCSFLVLSSYCGLVCSSDVLLTSKVQEYTITMENPAILGSKSLRQLLETLPRA